MSEPNPLCDYCSQIPLDPRVLDRYHYESGAEIIKFPLGPGSRIKNSPCPLCRLVVETFTKRFIATNYANEVEMWWPAGPSNRHAFSTTESKADTWIGFSSSMQPPDSQIYGKTNDMLRYCIEPETVPIVDVTRILHWISSCEQLHGPTCALTDTLNFDEAFRGLHVLRLVDVQDNCLVEKTSLERYIALSYVWGAVSNFRLTMANRPALLVPGSVEKVGHLIPDTIRDAIELTRRLGCRYLWVDALCLLQNDAEDLQLGVNAMDLVYERAWLTVIAGCGHDANSGLPGLRDGTRKFYQNTSAICPGVEMGIVTGMDGLLKTSVYDTRAWTFQEQVLSRRVLYFLDDRVFYRCRAAEHAEHFVDILSQNQRTGASLGSMLPEAVQMTEPVFDLTVMLFYYTKRVLSNQNDVSRAMTGITRRFADATKCSFFQDIPTAMFDRFVIFHGDRVVLHRRPSFPSYSWTGWKGPIDVDCYYPGTFPIDNEWLKEKTWIVWYKRNPSGITNPVWDLDANPSFPIHDMGYVGYRTRQAFADGRYVPGRLDTRRTMPTEQISFSRAVPSYPLLQFWTLSLFYGISDINVFEGTGHLMDSNQTKCALVYFDGFEETTFFDSRRPLEVILLSEAYSHASLMNESENEWQNNYPTTPGQCAFYHIMLLEWQGGIAERRGFGLLHQSAVQFSLAPGPTWKEILLA
ncbi:hypothetical protein FHETE_2048 [Fusarium heterosporum]|uniref:Heterokaryon incompatibility domain-containing protein n=1 Tax=Fusarium heterosporum TaxID=42747 RepID=A0A8H5TYD9_FUSHE|nr:hypothetical protein FHETE_2048 [Fusarium heterosporum]